MLSSLHNSSLKASSTQDTFLIRHVSHRAANPSEKALSWARCAA